MQLCPFSRIKFGKNKHTTMSTIINNIGGVINYHDHHKEYNIDARGKDLAAVMRAIDTENIQPVEEEIPTKGLFCRITKEAIEKGKGQEVEDELRSASVSAPKLIKAINTNEALGYLDTKNLNSSELYQLLDEHYGLTFGLSNFRRYRSF